MTPCRIFAALLSALTVAPLLDGETADVHAQDCLYPPPRGEARRCAATVEWPTLVRYGFDGTARELGRCRPEDRTAWERFYQAVNRAAGRAAYGVRL